MSVFGNYARYYDLLYRDKDYAAETAYVDGLIRELRPQPSTILELGCGTGAHALELAGRGYAVHGVDASNDMLARAKARWADLPAGLPKPESTIGDLRSVRVGRTFDVVLALFHVISYLPANDDLQAGFETAAAHLEPGGLLIFDFWYGPGVLTDPPVVRELELEDEHIAVHRTARPDLMTDRNLVDVHYRILVTDKASGSTEELKETHRMRYLFQPELELLLLGAGFETAGYYTWMTNQPAVTDTWNAVSVARYLGAGT